MDKKFLPIGTVCTLNGVNKKIMITGFLSQKLTDTLKVYDYVGVEYPEGMLLLNRIHTFNHTDIVSVNYMGYNNDEHSRINNILNNNPKTEETTSSVADLVFGFDEEGYVISQKKADVANPFTVTNDNANKAKEENAQAWPIFDDIGFDEEGYVIPKKNKSDNNQANDIEYEFDENGFVISEKGKAADPSKKVEELAYEFDEDGFVISEKGKTADPSKKVEEPAYEFDEDGFVIGEKK